jgi:cobalt-zinc-cadmium efflux system outer membrane protein
LVIAEYEQMPDLRFFRAGVSIPLPVFNRREGPVAEAAAGINQARSLVTALQLEIASSVERAYSGYQIANQQVISFESGPLRGAQTAVEGAEAAFRFGERGIIEVLDAQRVLRSIRSDYLNAQYDRESALIELEQLRAIDITSGAKGAVTP